MTVIDDLRAAAQTESWALRTYTPERIKTSRTTRYSLEPVWARWSSENDGDLKDLCQLIGFSVGRWRRLRTSGAPWDVADHIAIRLGYGHHDLWPDWHGDEWWQHDTPEPAARDPKSRSRLGLQARLLLDQGIHPANNQPIPPGTNTCGTCTHVVRGPAPRHNLKCPNHRLGVTTSKNSDVRASWPACPLYQPIETPVAVR